MKAAKKTRARYQRVDLVNVYLWDQHMGAVALDPTYGYYAFAYTPAFRASGGILVALQRGK